jgi:integrase
MTRIKLQFVHSFIDRHGKPRHYFRRPGFKRIPLPGLPGSTEFMAVYKQALSGETTSPVEIGARQHQPGTVAVLVTGYLQSHSFMNLLAEGTRRRRRQILERFRAEHGDKRVSKLERRHIEAMLAGMSATPGMALNFLIVVRALLKYAISLRLRGDDPTIGIQRPKRTSAGIYTWSEHDITAFETKYPIGTKARLAFGLLLYTAQRRSDVVRMGRQHVREGVIQVRQQKTGTPLAIPIHPELQKILDATPSDHLTFLTTRTGRPYAPADFSHWFKQKCRQAGLREETSVHGLRKAACRRLAEAGCSANVIAAISGHASLREVERYTRAADQERLAWRGIEAVSGGTKTQQPVANLNERFANSDKKP